jgi:hypothetical protein
MEGEINSEFYTEYLQEHLGQCLGAIEEISNKAEIGASEVPDFMKPYTAKLQHVYNLLGFMPLNHLHNATQARPSKRKDQAFCKRFTSLVNLGVGSALKDNPIYRRLGVRYLYQKLPYTKFPELEDLFLQIDPNKKACASLAALQNPNVHAGNRFIHQMSLVTFYYLAKEHLAHLETASVNDSEARMREFLQGSIAEVDGYFAIYYALFSYFFLGQIRARMA